MGRISIEEQLKTIFNEDYSSLLKNLIEKGFNSEEISQYIKNTFNVNVKKETVKIHIAKFNNGENTSNSHNKSAKTLLAEKGLDYKSLLQSLCNLNKDEMSDRIKQDYGIEIKPSTIYQYALKYGIKIAHNKYRKKKHKCQLDYLNSDMQGLHNQDLLINKLPLPPKRFHPTKHSGFVIFEQINAIIEMCAHLQINDRKTAHVSIWLKAYKDDLVEETHPVFEKEIKQNILETITEYNYVKICKEECRDEIEEIQNLTIPQLRSMLLVFCKDQISMENLLSKCHVVSKKS